jgi:phosphate transport system substrate-binding protein
MIRSRGDKQMGKVMSAWEIAFRRYHPQITFEDTLLGSATGMAGIITGVSDLTLLGRPVTPNEIIGFEWVHRVKPLGFEVMRGSLDTEGESPALAVLVSRRNPLTAISMAQLATILGCPADATHSVTWAAAGAQTPWSSHPLHAFLYDNQTGTGSFLMQKVQGRKDCWNWSIVHEFVDKERRDGSVSPAAQQIAEALERDPYGLAISTLAHASPRLKALPITVDGAPVPLTATTVSDGSYPLGRGVYIYVDRPKDKPVDPALAEFLRFVLSAEGQAIVAAAGDYIPLNPAAVVEEREKLR